VLVVLITLSGLRQRRATGVNCSKVGRGFAFDCCPGPKLGGARLAACRACLGQESGRSKLASQSVLHEVFRRQAEVEVLERVLFSVQGSQSARGMWYAVFVVCCR
jgi:hypothetical protein